jgi:hypothetical protein
MLDDFAQKASDICFKGCRENNVKIEEVPISNVERFFSKHR